LYAAILWMLFAAPFALRRWRRIKRGLCPACAYPVGASDVCTECGKPVKPREAHTPC
jgi:predicted amidophosphoribosyltransferase